MPCSHNGDPALAQATAASRQAARLREQLLPFTPKNDKPGFTSPVAYPKSEDAFPRRLAGLAAMLGARLPVRAVALTAPGMYDTHDDQPEALADGLALTASSLLAFQRDLEARGLADRVLVHVWSEFGRRAQENGSNGTDHGAAGIGFLVGTRVTGTMIGEYPGLAKLDQHGNLRATSDFRGLYASLLEDWLDTDADGIIPSARSFARPRILEVIRAGCSRFAALLAPSPARGCRWRGGRVPPIRRSRAQSIRSGPAIVELVNYGEDEHDLRLRRIGGTRTYRVGTVRPGGVARLETRLAPGRFVLWCSLADHRSRGMTARLTVRG